MLAYLASLILPFFLFSIGFWILGKISVGSSAWRWTLAYPVGMAVVGILALYLWLLGISWNLIVIGVAFSGVILGKDLFTELLRLSRTTVLSSLAEFEQRLRALETGESILLALAGFGLALVVVWHMFVQPVSWDSLVLYDFRALRISEGWQIERFMEQFPFDARFAAYDFSHPFLSSIWQALAYSTQAAVSTSLYLGFLLSVLATAWKVLGNRKAWLAFCTLLFASTLFFTVWTQNYSVEPYSLFWLLVLFLVSAKKERLPRQVDTLVLLFLVTTTLIRASEPYWLVFLLWLSWPVLRRQRPWSEKLLQLSFWWLPVLAVSAGWWQAQNLAQSLVQTELTKSVSSYDPVRYSTFAEVFFLPDLWKSWFQILLTRNTLLGTWLLAAFFLLLQGKSLLRDRMTWLLLMFTGMLAAALLVEMGGDWPEWEGKARLLQRAGLPVALLSIVITVQRIVPLSLTKESNRR